MKRKYKKTISKKTLIISAILIIISLAFFIILSDKDKFWIARKENNKKLQKNYNLVMISLDTLSATHLPCYGYHRNTAPNLCKFASENILFTNSFSHATWTLPSHVSIFTGLYPQTHKVVNYGDVLSKQIPFLPEILSNNGYNVYFEIPCYDNTMPRGNVYSRGIDEFLEYNMNINKSFESIVKTIKDKQKSFVFLHTYAVHSPYLTEDRDFLYAKDPVKGIPYTTEEYEKLTTKMTQYNGGYIEDEKCYLDGPFPIQSRLLDKDGPYWSNPIPNVLRDKSKSYWKTIDINNERHVNFIRDLYDQEIHMLDESLGRLLELFYQEGLDKNTILIITSDHGEEFNEHGELEHRTVYDPNLRVPIIMSLPDEINASIDDNVQLVDLMPTILDLLDIKTNQEFDGVSLVDLIKGGDMDSRLLLANLFYTSQHLEIKKVLRLDNWKLISEISGNGTLTPFELFDFIKDPQESNNLIYEKIQVVKDILSKYDKN